MAQRTNTTGSVSRRRFLLTGGAAAATGGLALPAKGEVPEDIPKINQYRRLGRTEFQVSDISIGGAAIEPNVYRYAYDRGINYFDNAEDYGEGTSEAALGQALQHMDRSKVFITTKFKLMKNDTEHKLLDRFGKCQERLRTDYVDGLLIRETADVEEIKNPAFHAVVRRLKSDGRLRHAGVACHGPLGGRGESMEKVITAAAEDGRFDLVLMAYNFMNYEGGGDNSLAACKKHDIGTTGMKSAPGMMEIPPFDPDNLSEFYQFHLDQIIGQGYTRVEALPILQYYVDMELEGIEQATTYMAEHGISTKKEFQMLGVKWVLSKPDMQTVCVSFRDFDTIDRFIPVSGTQIARSDTLVLDRFRTAFSSRYCRHGCTDCLEACPHALPVSTIMRFAYYYTEQGREKHAMQEYTRLGGHDGSLCAGCNGNCNGACPFGVNIRGNVLMAHKLLTLT